MLCQMQRRYNEAEPLYQRALTICENTLGLDHSLTRTVQHNYEIMQRARDGAIEYGGEYKSFRAACGIMLPDKGFRHDD